MTQSLFRRRKQGSRPRRLTRLLPLLLALTLAACGLSDAAKHTASAARSDFTATVQALKNARAAADAQLVQPAASFIVPAQRADAIGDGFTQAQKAIDAAAPLDAQLKSLLDKDDDGTAATVTTVAGQLTAKLAEAKKAMALPKQRIDGIITLHSNPQAAVATATSSMTTIDHLGDSMNVAQTKALAAHPDKADSIKKHAQTVTVPRAQADAAFTTLTTEVKSPTPNFVAAYNSAQVIQTTEPALIKAANELLPQFDQLDHSNVVTLVDMRMSCTIRMSRTSWDEAYDFPTETTHNFKDVVLSGTGPQDGALCTYWSGIGDQFEAKGDTDQQVGHINAGFFGRDAFEVEQGIDKAMWDNLHLTADEAWTSGDDAATFNLEGVDDARYYHKYDTTVDGVTTHGDWVEVSEQTFDDNLYDLGMDVSERQVGEFDDETNDEAAPPGMVYVGDPKYGTWATDSNNGNNSYWVWYGQYRYWDDLLGTRVYRNDWNDYRTHYYGSAGYYGNAGGKDRWGSLSPRGSTFSSSWTSTGGQRVSIRDAGPSGRAGGPGGGGK